MPEAAVHKNDGIVFGQDDVGFPGELPVVRGVDSEAVAHPVGSRDRTRSSGWVFLFRIRLMFHERRSGVR